MLRIHNEPNHVQSQFVKFALSRDIEIDLESVSADDLPKLSFLRCEFTRLRPGMADFLVRVATPLYKNNVKSNTIITIRANRSLGNMKGAQKIADLIAEEMRKREDNTHKWDNLNSAHLAKMLVASLQFFIKNSASEKLQFTTEALL